MEPMDATGSTCTTNINIGTNLFLNEFETILLKSKQVKHRQQKISGISVAGEFWYNQSDKHFFCYLFAWLID